MEPAPPEWPKFVLPPRALQLLSRVPLALAYSMAIAPPPPPERLLPSPPPRASTTPAPASVLATIHTDPPAPLPHVALSKPLERIAASAGVRLAGSGGVVR